MRCAVIGCGSIGLRHLRNLRSIGVADVIAHDVSEPCRAQAAQINSVAVASAPDEVWRWAPDVALICTPASSHVSVAREAVERGCHVFIEKPLAATLDGIDELLERAELSRRLVIVGCNFRFDPGLQRVKELVESGTLGTVVSARAQFSQYLPDWHPWEDYRNGYSARSENGGLIIDQFHELDYLTWMFGDVAEVVCLSGKLGRLEIAVDDTVEMLLRFRRGPLAEIHYDYLGRVYQRTCQLVGDEGVLHWSYQDRDVKWYAASDARWHVERWPEHDGNAMYVAQLRHLLDCVTGKTSPVLDGRGAKRLLEIALAIQRSQSSRACVSV